MTFATRFAYDTVWYRSQAVLTYAGVAGFIILLKEVIKLANYGLELRKSAFDMGQKCCTFDVQNSTYNLYHEIAPTFFF